MLVHGVTGRGAQCRRIDFNVNLYDMSFPVPVPVSVSVPGPNLPRLTLPPNPRLRNAIENPVNRKYSSILMGDDDDLPKPLKNGIERRSG